MVRLEGGAEEAAEGWFHRANVAVCRTRSGAGQDGRMNKENEW